MLYCSLVSIDCIYIYIYGKEDILSSIVNRNWKVWYAYYEPGNAWANKILAKSHWTKTTVQIKIEACKKCLWYFKSPLLCPAWLVTWNIVNFSPTFLCQHSIHMFLFVKKLLSQCHSLVSVIWSQKAIWCLNNASFFLFFWCTHLIKPLMSWPWMQSRIHVTNTLWGHNWKLVTILFALSFILMIKMRSQICACHDSWAVVACAKLWPLLIIVFNFNMLRNFSRFGLQAPKPFVKCISGHSIPESRPRIK